MSKGFVLSLILLAVLLFGLFYMIKTEGYFSLSETLLRVGVPADKIPQQIKSLDRITIPKREIPAEYQSGNSRFSQGVCSQDKDCKPSGCSKEVCGTEEEVTTCEFAYTFPNPDKYTCGCNNSRCGWR